MLPDFDGQFIKDTDSRNRSSRMSNIVFFISCTISCQNLAPTLSTTQSDCWQFSHIFMCVTLGTANVFLSCKSQANTRSGPQRSSKYHTSRSFFTSHTCSLQPALSQLTSLQMWRSPHRIHARLYITIFTHAVELPETRKPSPVCKISVCSKLMMTIWVNDVLRRGRCLGANAESCELKQTVNYVI